MATYENAGGTPPSPNSRMLQLISQLTNQIHDMQTQQAHIHESIAALQRGRNTTPFLSTGPTPSEFPLPESPRIEPAPNLVFPDQNQHRKKTLPDPPKFSGARSTYRSWAIEMRNKLAVDGHILGSAQNQFAYIYSRLDQKPQDMTVAFMEKGGPDGLHNPQKFLDYLANCYGDPNAQKRALMKLRSLKQGDNESFATFLPKFEKELADSGGGGWTDEVRINHLQGAINDTLQNHLISLKDEPTEYPEYVALLSTIGSRIEGLRKSTHSNRNRREQQPPPTRYTGTSQRVPSPTIDQSEVMDWEPTKVNKAIQRGNRELEGKRAKWVSPAEMKARREEGRCLRCGRTGCYTSICPLKPAQRPLNPTKASKIVYHAAVEDDDFEGPVQDASESEKE